MSISDGQSVNASNSNAAWASKTANNTMSGTQTLSNGGSGPSISNLQQEINDIKDLNDQQTTDIGNKISTTEKGAANGVASLDGTGRIPTAQLTVEVMEYKGVYNATTNTPTLVNGTGSTGDLYRVSVAGTQDFGAGNITFVVGDFVIYNGTIWEKATASGNFATRELDNLTTAAVNVDLNPGTANTWSLGTIVKTWKDLILNKIKLYSSVAVYWTGTTSAILVDNDGSPSIEFMIGSEDAASGSVATKYTTIASGAQQFTSSVNTGRVTLITGDQADSSSTGDTGDFFFSTGWVYDGSGDTGGAQLTSGDINNGTGASGAVFVNTGLVSSSSTQASGQIQVVTGGQNGSGATGAVTVKSGVSSSGASGAVVVGSGNSTNGVTGNVTLQTGTTAGTRGKILLKDGSEGTAGHVWTSTDTTGKGAWAAAGASGANTALSNLASTAVNDDIVAAVADNNTIGSLAKPWQTVFSSAFFMKSPSAGAERNAYKATDGSGNEAFIVTINPSTDMPSFSNVASGLTVTRANTAAKKGIALYTACNSTADANPTGTVYVGSGDKTAGTGNSGDVVLLPGTSAGGDRGQVKINGFSSVKSSSALPQTWGSDLPAITFDGSNTEITSAGAASIIFEGNESQGEFVIASADINSASSSSFFYWRTGENAGSGNTGGVDIASGNQTGASGNSGIAFFKSGDSANGNSGEVRLLSGSAASGNSGNVLINTGGAGGTRGNIQLEANIVNCTQTPFNNFRAEFGTTASRPGSPVTAQQYFDTDLGIPIWYDGTNWIDATGTTV
jgi:hypothetical protein